MKTYTKTLSAVLGVSLSAMACSHAVVISYDPNIGANFSTTDSLQGITANVGTGSALYIGTGGDGLNGQNIADNGNVTTRLTDATSSTTPTLSVMGADVTVGWDFNVSSLPGLAANRQLDSLTIWQSNTGAPRTGSNFSLQTSLNGTTWTTIPGTGALYDNGSPTTSTYNRIAFTFSASEVTNFDYLRVLDSAFGGFSVPITEIDATISNVPEPSTCLLVAFGLTSAVIFRRRRMA